VIRKIADYVTTGIVYYIAGVTLHEFFHYRVASVLGYEVEAHFPTLLSGFVSIPSSIPPLHLFMIGIAGGAFTCLFFALTSLFTKDVQTDVVLGFFAPIHGFYAVFEVLYLFNVLPLWVSGTVPVMLSAPILLFKVLVKQRSV